MLHSPTRFGYPRIAIAHQSVMIGDAIGNDIAGAYRVLDGLGFPVTIVCEHSHPEVATRHRVLHDLSPARIAAEFDLLIYHHSIEWMRGEQCLAQFAGAVVVKYHNITPAHFFEPYSTRYFEVCVRGRAQTARLAKLAQVVRWLGDSAYNADEIRGLGVADDRIAVLPPFTRCDELFMTTHRAGYDASLPIEMLFVGRRAPNKGHVHLLRVLASFRELFPEQAVRLTVIGMPDDELSGYYREVQDLERALGVAGCVRWLTHVTDSDVRSAFETSHVYLNLSEHEGFCVPVVEAQAIGLPVVACDSSAVRETLGDGQIVVPLPRTNEDYDLIAGLAREVARNATARRQIVATGCRNVYRRFMTGDLQDQFLAEIEPWLRPSSAR